MVAFILVCLVLLLGLLWGWEIRKRKSLEQEFVKKKNEVCSVKEFSDTILYNVDAYIILVDRNFLVEKTNYYNLNNTSEGQVLRRVGELLRCKNGLDAGACGSHENCKVCPVRNSIEKCFREKGHFSPLETPMRLYMSEKMDNYVDCIVCVSGTYLQLDQDDKVLLTVRDVTRQKKILDELEEARRNAEWAGEQKTAFLANMSHDIRTPMNGIIGTLNLANRYPDDLEVQRKCREQIMTSSKYLVSIVNDILDMNKLESGGVVEQEIPFNLAELLNRVNLGKQKQAAEKNVEYIVDWEQSDIRHMDLAGNPIYVERLLTNISDNAVKFTGPGGSVRVWCAEKYADEERVVYEFGCADTGIGMSETFLEHAFEPFTQENETSRSRYEGTGLGLAIAKKIVDRLDGDIAIESKKGVGTTVTMTLPFKIGEPVEKEKNVNYEEIPVEGLRALLAEDNELNMEIAKFMLEDYGIHVECAADGEEAVQKFKNLSWDITM